MKLSRLSTPSQLGALTFLLGLILTTLATWQVVRVNRENLAEAVVQRAERLRDEITQRLRLYTYGLRGVRGHFLTAGENVSRSAFLLYSQSRDIDTEFPGARGFGFVRRVPAAAEQAFIERSREEGFTDMGVQQLTPHAGERFVIQYAEPFERNHQAVGFDIASEENRRTAAIASMRTGKANITGPITLMQASGFHHQSFLILLPVYRTGWTPATEAEREAATIGWSYVALLMQDVLKDLPVEPQFFFLELFDVTDKHDPFYVSASPAEAASTVAANYSDPHILDFDVLGRRWQMELQPTHAFARSVRRVEPLQAFTLGLLFSALTASLVSLVAVGRRRKRQMSLAQANLAALVKNSTDAIIGKTLEGVITSWNRGAETMFDIPAKDAVGQRVLDLIVPQALAEEEAGLMARLRRNESISSFETRRRRRDGTELDVSLALSPLCDDAGHIAGISTTVRDITTQKAAEAEIRESLETQVAERTSELDEAHRNLQNILDGLPMLVGYWDRDLVNHLANHCYEEWFGVAAFSIPGMNMEELVGAELLAEVRPAIDEALAGGRPHFETTIPARDEQPERHIVVHYIPDIAGDSVQGFYAIAHDITDYRVMQNRHDQLRQLLEAVLNSASEVAIIAADAYGQITLFNTGAERMLGYKSREVVGWHNLLDFHRPDELTARAMELQAEVGTTVEGFQVLKTLPERTGSETRHWTYIRNNGSELRVSLAVTPIRDLLGEIEGYLGIALDITAEQQSRQRLLALSHQLQIAAEAAELGIWRWNLENDRLDWNERMFELYEQPVAQRDEGVSKEHWLERLHPEDRDHTMRELEAAVLRSERFEMHFRLLLPSGKLRYIHCVALVSKSAEGEAVQVTGINRDVTRQREYEALIQREKDLANAANLAKSAFLANMSHEIRTPLNAVLGMLQLVGKTALDNRQHDYIHKAHSAAKSLLVLLNDLLDFSKIDSGKLELDLHPFEPETLLRELAVVLSGNQLDKDLEILFDVDSRIPRTLIGDSLRLRQILINLAGNALKFTVHGHVTVAFQQLRRDAEHVVLRISVKDTGIGISAEQLARIFDGFVQGETSTSRRFGGTGLGLSISKRLVNLMGGDLHVESEPGVGSHFWFDIAFAPASELPLLPARPPGLELKVLVVDDNPLAIEILTRMIQSIGWQVAAAASGGEAIEMVAAARAQGAPYQLVLMDWRMPGIDGVQTTERIGECLGEQTPVVVMVTAFGRETLADLVQRGAPFRDLLTKPVTPQQLLESITRLFPDTQALPVPPTTVPAALAEVASPLAGLSILVVEDNAINRQVAEELLAGAGAQVSLAEGGGEALEKLEHQSFDVVIMDMQMPGIDGLETTRRIRAQRRFAQLPILAMTANAAPVDRQACISAGMNDHVSKPIDLTHVIPALLRLVGAGRMDPPPAEVNPTEPPIRLVEDESRILQRFGGNRVLFVRLIARFQPEAVRHLSEIRQHLAAEEIAGLTATLHSFKGVAANMGASALAAMLASLERRFKDQPGGKAGEILDPLALKALEQLAQQSTAILTALGGSESPTAKPSTGIKPASAAYNEQLRSLKTMLAAGDLRAVQMVESMAANRPDDNRLQAIASKVQSLDFAAAAQALSELIQHGNHP